MWETPETQYARRGAMHIAYQIVGARPPRIAFVPEWLSHLEAQWDWPPAAQFLRRLAGMGGALLFNRRGTGLSDPVPPDDLPTLEQWTQDLEIVLDAVGAERITLVGCAGGGPICALFAASHPERVDRLVLINSFASLAAAPDNPSGIDADTRSRLVAGVLDSWGTGGASLEWVAPSAAGDAEARRWLARYERLSAPPAMAAAIISMATQLDVRAVLPSIRVPTLVIHRAGARFAPKERGQAMAHAIPDATYLEIPGEDMLFWAGDHREILTPVEEFVTGSIARRSSEERVFVTMMFTDLVGSTPQVAKLGDSAWSELLEAHDICVRNAVNDGDGRVLKTTGDGVLAVFDGPASALSSAFSIREGLGHLGLQVRVGVHSGEVERRGSDITGLGVHVAARIQALAGAGEILASTAVRDLAAGAGLGFGPKGHVQLRGIPGDWPIFSVEHTPSATPERSNS